MLEPAQLLDQVNETETVAVAGGRHAGGWADAQTDARAFHGKEHVEPRENERNNTAPATLRPRSSIGCAERTRRARPGWSWPD